MGFLHEGRWWSLELRFGMMLAGPRKQVSCMALLGIFLALAIRSLTPLQQDPQE